jgi:hypothetical protein
MVMRYHCATGTCVLLPEVKRYRYEVSYLIVAVAAFVVGVYIGAKYLGGPWYVREIARANHRTLRRQAGLRERS